MSDSIKIDKIKDPTFREAADLADMIDGNEDGFLVRSENPELYDRIKARRSDSGTTDPTDTRGYDPLADYAIDVRQPERPTPDYLDGPGMLFPGGGQLGGQLGGITNPTAGVLSTGSHIATTIGSAGVGAMVAKSGQALAWGRNLLGSLLKTGSASSVVAVTTVTTRTLVRTALSSSVAGALVGAGISFFENGAALAFGTRTWQEARSDFAKDALIGAGVAAVTGVAAVAGAPILVAIGVGILAGWGFNKLFGD